MNFPPPPRWMTERPMSDFDTLEQEFRRLESEVRQRECDHSEMQTLHRFGAGDIHLCPDCGYSATA